MLRRSRPVIAWTTIDRWSPRRCKVPRSSRRTRPGSLEEARCGVHRCVAAGAAAGWTAGIDDLAGEIAGGRARSVWLPDTGYGALAPMMQEYFEHGLEHATAAIGTGCWCSTAWRIAGCRGTPRNGRSPSDTPTLPGIRMAPTAGPRITFRWSRAPRCRGHRRRMISVAFVELLLRTGTTRFAKVLQVR